MFWKELMFRVKNCLLLVADQVRLRVCGRTFEGKMLTFNILVGLLTCSVGKALGASRVIAVDVKSECLDLAVKMGADITVNPAKVPLGDEIMKLTNQNGIQRIVEASGHAQTLSQCLKWLRKGGKLGIVGIPKGEVKFENPLPGILTNIF